MYDAKYAGHGEKINERIAQKRFQENPGVRVEIFLRTQSERSVRELSSNSLERILVRILCALAVIVPV